MITFDNLFAKKLLEADDARTFLREKIPALNRLENLVGLSGLELKEVYAHPASPTTRLFYEGLASPDLYSHLLDHLIGQGITDPNNIIETDCQDLGKSRESAQVLFGLYDNSVHISLKVYNSRYRA